MAELYPDGQLLFYRAATRAPSARRLRSDLDSTPLTMTGGSWCPARMLYLLASWALTGIGLSQTACLRGRTQTI